MLLQKKTKVIIPVDIAGIIVDYDKIFKIVEEKKNLFKPNNEIQKLYNRIIVVADSAHGIGHKKMEKCQEKLLILQHFLSMLLRT